MLATEPLRQEHRAMHGRIEGIRAAGDLVGRAPAEEVDRAVRGVIEFLHGHLIPHAKAEERFLYPEVGRIFGSPGATRTMVLDHMEIGRLTLHLERAAEEGDEPMMRAALYGLYAIIELHVRKEEELYLPLLDDRMERADVEAMIARMRQDAHGAHGAP